MYKINSLILEGDYISYEVKDDVGIITIENNELFKVVVKGKLKNRFEQKKDIVKCVRVVGRLTKDLIVAEHIELKYKV